MSSLLKPALSSLSNTEAIREPVQCYNFVSGLQLPSSTPASHPFVSTDETSFTSAAGHIFYSILWELSQKWSER